MFIFLCYHSINAVSDKLKYANKGCDNYLISNTGCPKKNRIMKVCPSNNISNLQGVPKILNLQQVPKISNLQVVPKISNFHGVPKNFKFQGISKYFNFTGSLFENIS